MVTTSQANILSVLACCDAANMVSFVDKKTGEITI